jgi:lysozyme family protein
MALFLPAFEALIVNEGGFSNYKEDPGGATQYGVSLRFLKTLGTYGDIDRNGIVDEDDIKLIDLDFSKDTYKKYFWDSNRYGDITYQGVATKIFDMAVNMGSGRANRLLQEACNHVLSDNPLVIDGNVGGKTLGKVNKIDASMMQNILATLSSNYYLHICEGNEALKVFLKGWLVRASKKY